MKALQVLVGGIVLVSGMLVVAGLALYALWWLSLILIRRIPMIGRRHRHPDWDRLNRP